MAETAVQPSTVTVNGASSSHSIVSSSDSSSVGGGSSSGISITTTGPFEHPLSPDVSFASTSRTSYFRAPPASLVKPDHPAIFGSSPVSDDTAGCPSEVDDAHEDALNDGRRRAGGSKERHGLERTRTPVEIEGGKRVRGQDETPRVNAHLQFGSQQQQRSSTSSTTIRLPQAPHHYDHEELLRRLAGQSSSSTASTEGLMLSLVRDLSEQLERNERRLALKEKEQELREQALLQLLRDNAAASCTEGTINRALVRAKAEAQQLLGGLDGRVEVGPWKMVVDLPTTEDDAVPASLGLPKAEERKRPMLDVDLQEAMSDDGFRDDVQALSPTVSIDSRASFSLNGATGLGASPASPPASALHERRGRTATQSLASRLFGNYSSPVAGSSASSSQAVTPATPHFKNAFGSSTPSVSLLSAEASPDCQSHDATSKAAKRTSRADSIMSVASASSSISNSGASKTASNPSSWGGSVWGWRNWAKSGQDKDAAQRTYGQDTEESDLDTEDDQVDEDNGTSPAKGANVETSLGHPRLRRKKTVTRSPAQNRGSDTKDDMASVASHDTATKASTSSLSRPRTLSKSSGSALSYETTANTSYNGTLDDTAGAPASGTSPSRCASPLAQSLLPQLNMEKRQSSDSRRTSRSSATSPLKEKDGPIRALLDRRPSGLHPATALSASIPTAVITPTSSTAPGGSAAMLQSLTASARGRLPDIPETSHFRALSDSASTIGKSSGRKSQRMEDPEELSIEVKRDIFLRPNRVSINISAWTLRLLESFEDTTSPTVVPSSMNHNSSEADNPPEHTGGPEATFPVLSAVPSRAKSPRLHVAKSKATLSPATLLNNEETTTATTIKLTASTPVSPHGPLSGISNTSSVESDEAVPLATETARKQKGYLSSAKGTIGRALGLSGPSATHSGRAAGRSSASMPKSRSSSSSKSSRREGGVEPALTLPSAFNTFGGATSNASSASIMTGGSTSHRVSNIVEMGTIVAPEAKPPTLSSDLTDQMKDGPLVDRFGFVYDVKAGMKLLKESRKKQQTPAEAQDLIREEKNPAEDHGLQSPTTEQASIIHTETEKQVDLDELREAIGPSPMPTPSIESGYTSSIAETAVNVLPVVGEEAENTLSPLPTKKEVPVKAPELERLRSDSTSGSTLSMAEQPSNQSIRRLLNQLGEMNENVEKTQRQGWDDFIRKRRKKVQKAAHSDDAVAAIRARKEKRMTVLLSDTSSGSVGTWDDAQMLQAMAEQPDDFSEYLVGVATMGTDKQDDKTFRQLVRAGVPIVYRPSIWAEVSGASELREPGVYQELLKRHEGEQSPCLEQIDMDTHRTFPTNIFFAGSGPGVQKLRRVLIAYSWRDPHIGYCQGMNLLAALLLLVYPDEEDAFWMLSSVLERILPSDYYSAQLLVSQADQRVLQDLVQIALPELYAHLDDLGVDLPAITFGWFLSLFTDALPIQTLLRVWDVLFVHGPITLFKIAIAIFKIHSTEIFATDSASTFYVLLTNLTSHLYSADKLLKTAFDDLKLIRRHDIESRRLQHVADIERELAGPLGSPESKD